MARFLKLERMEIHGFKSFYGRTRFDFPEGITAVVGPNGCGKSNIGDAISWVLGEQKASSLRSDRMEDVIFNGSQGRKPLGMAEVSLHFRNVRARLDAACGTIDPTAVIEEAGNGNGNGNGNGHGHAATEILAAIEVVAEAPIAETAADGSVAAEPAADGVVVEGAAPAEPSAANFFLEDLPEDVVVTRRLFRSGESEYAVNGERCRLRDVQDLLVRTEIGTRLYTTIEQGKIDQILLAKPKERRVIIEEAAGILGYKIKRRQTEQKLEATHANLLRIADIVAEVDKQIQSLRRQAAKARRYRKLMESLRERRAVVAWRRLLSQDAERQAAEAAIADLGAREAAALADLGRAEAEREELRVRLESEEEVARQRRDALHALDLEIDRLQARRRAGDEQASGLQERAQAAETEIGTLVGRIAEQEGRRDTLTAGLAADAARVQEADAALVAIESDHRTRAAAIAADEGSLETLRGDLLGLLDRITEMSRRRASLEEQERAAEAVLLRLDRESAQTEEGREALRSQVAGLDEEAMTRRADHASRTLDHERLALELRATEENLAVSEKRLEELRGRGTALSERLTSLRTLEALHAGMADGVADLMRGAGGFSPLGIVGERIDVPAGLERAVAAALGRLQEAIVVASRQEAGRGVSHLRANAGGRVSFLSEQPVAGVVRTLPASLAGRDGVDGVLLARVQGVAPGGAVAARLGRSILVRDMDTAIALHAEEGSWTFVTPEGDLVEADGVVTGGEGAELQHGVLARRAEQAELARQIDALASERVALEDAVAGLHQEVAGGRERLEQAAAVLVEMQRELFQAEVRLSGQQAELSRLDGTMPVLRSEADRLRRERQEHEQERHPLANALAACEEERRGREEAIRAGAESLATARLAIEAIQRQAGEARAQVAAGQQRLAGMAREREAVEEGLNELRQRALQRGAERDEHNSRAASLREQEAGLATEIEQRLGERAQAAAADEAGLAGLAYDRSLLHAREQAAREGRDALAAVQKDRQEQEIRLARLASDRTHLEASCRDDLALTLEALRAAPPGFDASRPIEEEEAEVAATREGLESIGPVNLMAIEQCAELEERFGFLSTQKSDLEASIESLRDSIRRINRETRQRFTAAFESIQAGFRDSFVTLFGGGRAELRLQEGEDDVLEAGVEIAAQPPGKRLQSLALLSGGEKALTAVALLFALFRYRPSPFCVLDEVDAPLDEANVERFTSLLRKLTDDTQFILITHNRKSMESANLLYGVTMEEPGVSKVLPLRFE
jgi:chromosome segregation protein